jgi:hypothetical protein
VQTNNKETASRQTHARNNKINEEKHKWKRAKKRAKTSEADSFRNMKIKYPTPLKMAI